MKLPIIIYTLASTLDAVSTAWCLRAGCREANPIIAKTIAVVGEPVIAIMIAKFLCLAVLIGVARFRRWPANVQGWAVVGASLFGLVAGVSNLLKLL